MALFGFFTGFVDVTNTTQKLLKYKKVSLAMLRIDTAIPGHHNGELAVVAVSVGHNANLAKRGRISSLFFGDCLPSRKFSVGDMINQHHSFPCQSLSHQHS